MRIVKVTERMLWSSTEVPKCPMAGCNRNIRVGQYVLEHGRGQAKLRIHVSCVREAVADVPEDDADPIAVDAQFERMRREFAGASR